MVTLLELSAELGTDLVPTHGGKVPAYPLTGVHVSELEDPTPYLEGGELLLTTGIPLRNNTSAGEYVSRLRAKAIHAVGIGLGPWMPDVPEGLSHACREAGVELLKVPERVPFLNVSRAFWGLAGRSGQADLMGSLGTQTALARAAMRPDAPAAVVRGLAEELNGWAAYLPARHGPEAYWPASTQEVLPQLRAETVRLNRTGVHSAATFELRGGPVVEYPIADGDQILGFLAAGPGRRMTAADRQIILTVCTLLAITARERQTALSAAATLGAAVVKLLLGGQPEAARSLAADAGLPDLPPQVRMLALRAHHHDGETAALIEEAAQLTPASGLPALAPGLGSSVLRLAEDDVVYLVLTEAELADPRAGRTGTAESRDLDVSAVLSEPVFLSQAGTTKQLLRSALAQVPPGRLEAAAAEPHTRAEEWVQALADCPGTDLLGAVAAYLRCRGRWEKVARELGMHRNSVRHRIGVAESLLGVSLDDPDVAAPLWLALRRGA